VEQGRCTLTSCSPKQKKKACAKLVVQVEVVSDAVDIVLGVRLPEKAFYRARAEVLMGLSIEQVKVGMRVCLECLQVSDGVYLGQLPRC
jgi:hypothetical protein